MTPKIKQDMGKKQKFCIIKHFIFDHIHGGCIISLHTGFWLGFLDQNISTSVCFSSFSKD